MIKPIRSEVASDVRLFFRELPGIFRKLRLAVLLTILFLLIILLFLLPYDQPASNYFATTAHEPWKHIAHLLRRWGDFRDTVTVTLLIFISGCIFRRRNWRRLAVAFFLSASLAGIGVNILRFTTGRPRPYVQNIEDRWYGPVMLYPKSWIPNGENFFAFQSFPSGHSGTSVGAATMLMIACPPIGVAMALSAGGVVWSSLYANKHYPTDVTAGTAIGLVFGVAGGLAYRRMRSKAGDTPEAS